MFQGLRPPVKPYGRISRIRLSCKVAPSQGATKIGQRFTNTLLFANKVFAASFYASLGQSRQSGVLDSKDSDLLFPYSRVPSRIHLAVDSCSLSAAVLTLV